MVDNSSAVAAPDWTIAHSQPEWIERYSDRMEDYYLPKAKSRRVEQAEVYGRDGLALLNQGYFILKRDFSKSSPCPALR